MLKKRFLLMTIVLLVACTKKSEPAKETSTSSAESSVSHTGSVQFPNVSGLSVQGNNIKMNGSEYYAEDVKVLDSLSGKVIDEFELFYWGGTKLRFESNRVVILPAGDGFSITYRADEGGVSRMSTCHFKPDQKLDEDYKATIEKVKQSKVDWEDLLYFLSELAQRGNKNAADFFLNPSPQQKVFYKKSDGEASIDPVLKVLKFMQENGCHW